MGIHSNTDSQDTNPGLKVVHFPQSIPTIDYISPNLWLWMHEGQTNMNVMRGTEFQEAKIMSYDDEVWEFPVHLKNVLPRPKTTLREALQRELPRVPAKDSIKRSTTMKLNRLMGTIRKNIRPEARMVDMSNPLVSPMR